MDLTAAYLSCEQHARSHYANFPVASVLLPKRMRPHVTAVYAFARAADDFADEGRRSPAERLGLLDRWESRLRDAAVSPLPGPPPAEGEPGHAIAIFLALGASIRRCALPVPLFADLLSAFRQDVLVTRYATWDELFDYCRRSANPIGRLVLRIAGHDDARLDGCSDALCTALQLTNFWQDRTIDQQRGRIYLPAEEPSLAAAVARTRALFEAGRPLCDLVRGRLRYELRATWLGGVRILDRLERAGLDAGAPRPRLGPADAAWIAARTMAWRTR
jgi:phytoene synthase